MALSISRGVPFQDVAKAGLMFGDEGIFQRSKDSFFLFFITLDSDPEEEKEEQKALEVKFQPLIEWLKYEAKDSVLDGTNFDKF
jgi:heat shock protein 90kDa beta